MNRYHVGSFLFTFAIGTILHISGQFFFQPVVYSLEGILITTASGLGISISLPIIYITRSILKNNETKEYDEIIDEFQNNPIKFKGDGKITSFQVGKFALNEIDLYNRAKNKVVAVATFLVLYLIVIQFIDLTSIISASAIRGAFRSIMSATAFGFVLFTMIDETY